MTSRQPGQEPPGGLSSGGWPVRVIPLALLLILALAGLRGSIARPRWSGPMHNAAVGVGVALTVVLAILLTATWLRRRRALAQEPAQQEADAEADVAAKLRGVLFVVLSLGIATLGVLLIYAAHLNLGNGKPRPSLPSAAAPRTRPSARPRGPGRPDVLSVPISDILYGLLVVALISAVLLSIWWSRRLRGALGTVREIEETEESEDLRQAVESGRSALRTLDDARAAIIACYVAMERSLADRGAARGVAGTPDELLARATSGNIVHGTAPARLTVLFYEARFSSHPMEQTQRRAAEQTLDELAAALGPRPEHAEAST